MAIPPDQSNCCVFQEWMFSLPMQQQTVLVAACRGPDGVGKTHPSKAIVRRYRASVLKSAYAGRALRIGEELEHDGFMSLVDMENAVKWRWMLHEFFNIVDSLPHHYYMHLAHGAQIIGNHHPVPMIAMRWHEFYLKCCHDLHMNPEPKGEMDARLSDWRRRSWERTDGR